MLVGPPGNVPACPCAKTALTRAYYIDLLQPITVVQSCFQKTHQDFFLIYVDLFEDWNIGSVLLLKRIDSEAIRFFLKS